MEQTITSKKSQRIGRRGLERLDMLLLLIESLDLNASEAMIWIAHQGGLDELFPNRVELWKRRCHNPLRKSTRRGLLPSSETDALIKLVCLMADRLYPLIRQLLSSTEPSKITAERWLLLRKRLIELVEERMNPRKGAVQKLVNSNSNEKYLENLVLTLALSSGAGGNSRLRASLLDNLP